MSLGPATETQITHSRRLWLYIVGALVLGFLVAPSVLIAPISFSDSRYLAFPPPGWSLRWYEAYFTSLEWRQATVVSFLAAFLTMIIATLLGTLAAYSLHTMTGPLMQAAYVLFMLPLIIPAILIAIGTFLLYAHLGLNNTLTGIVLAHSVMAIPLVVITVASGLKSFDMSSGACRAEPRRKPPLGVSDRYPSSDPSVGHHSRPSRVHHLPRRGGHFAVRSRRRLHYADEANVQRPS